MTFKRHILLFCIVRSLFCSEEIPGNLTDVHVCKVSHLGLEYLGSVAKTESAVRCQSWSTDHPVHKVDEKLTDNKFPDGSRKAARNYCRNPNRDRKGPWCYTMNHDLIDETCGLPLCILTECKITGSGMEYGGKHNKAMSDRNCLKWNKERNNVKYNGGQRTQSKFEDFLFPDEKMKDAKKYCRNPDADLGGPWCFVEIEDTELIEKEYCDIPFCDDQDCMVFTKNSTKYSHYTDFSPKLANITFGIKLWDPDSYLDAHAKLVLSLLALPVDGNEMQDLGTGIEIHLSNRGSGITFGNKEQPQMEPSKGILKSTEYNFFSLSWSSGILSLNREGEVKPLFLEEFNVKDNLLGVHNDKFMFYSAQGTNVMWSFPFCDDDDDCDVHTTTTGFFQQFWPLRESPVGQDLKIYVRGAHSANILLVPSPAVSYPQAKLTLLASDNFTRLLVTEYPKAASITVTELQLPNILNLWKWHEFSISLFSDTLQLYWTKETGTHMISELKHTVFHQMRWFSPSSDDGLVKWTFNCEPPESAQTPPAWLPECALNPDEPDYRGTQSVTHEGLPCLPWAATKVVPDLHGKFSEGETATDAFNYCRDVGKEGKGTFCYAVSQASEKKVSKKYCRLRKCKSAECKVAGTGNDYIGKLNVTRSKRTCQHWTVQYLDTNVNKSHDKHIKNATLPNRHRREWEDMDNADTTPLISTTTKRPYVTPIHKVDPTYLNQSLYADNSVEDAQNYCRNPSRNIAGSWCYTTDKYVERDMCNIKDCDKPEECIIVTRGKGEGRRVYILPQWKETGIHGGLHFAIKTWDPDLLDGLIFEVTPIEGESQLKLVIGADNNEKIVLFENGKAIKDKTLPHLIPAGKWASFWLQIRQGEILLGYEGVPNALFEWTHENPTIAFVPMFLQYMSIKGSPLGLFFKCDECHTENTTVKHCARIMPIGLWSEEEKPTYDNFTLKLRGTGIALIPLMILPGSEKFYAIIIDGQANTVSFIEDINRRNQPLSVWEVTNGTVFTPNSWTHFHVSFTEHSISIFRETSLILQYNTSEPILFYWFCVGAEKGWITWTANCEPLDIDGPPRDGGWSQWGPWQCTVSCGGGEGVRTRTCSNPRPNIFGRLCEGPPSSTGRCNDFECGDISPDTMNLIRQRLQTQQFSFTINETGSVILQNDQEMLKKIERESPEAYYEWTKNGIFIKPSEDHIGFKKDDVHIWNAKPSDAGTYVCMVYRVNNQRLVLRVMTLAVISVKYDVNTRATRPLTFVSNAVVLGYIYSELTQKWLLNGTVYKDYGITTLAAVSAETIESLNMSHSGEWQCVVEQKDLKLKWVTNYVRVKVKSKPNLYTHLMEDHLTAPLFSWLKSEKMVLAAVIFIVVFVLALVAVCIVLYLKFGRLPTKKKKYKRNRRK